MDNIELIGTQGCSNVLTLIASHQGPVTRTDVDSWTGADSTDHLNRLRLSGSVTTDRDSIFLTRAGGMHALLVKALNGAPIDPILRELARRYGTSKYQLIEDNMAREFLRRVQARPGFGSLYICSPWIGFDEESEALIRSIAQDERNGGTLTVNVLTRPKQAQGGIEILRSLGATISFRSSLHTKLFIREPGKSGGTSLAILGSQNLTRSTYDELGIAVVNDGVVNARLIAYFKQIAAAQE
jgi:hypothetical protein